MRLLPILICLFFPFYLFGQSPIAYRIVDSQGKDVSWSEMLSELKDARVIFFGEDHKSKTIHWLQKELFKDLQQFEKWDLGMEMFEADQQQIIDEYLKDVINTKAFEEDVRKWSNYKTDYKGLIEFAKENESNVIATNIPRRYAKKVYHDGEKELISMSQNLPHYFPDLPLNIDTSLQSYKNLMMPMHGDEVKYLLEAQAIKDAVMAKSICSHIKNNDRPLLHINGYYHSDFREGILSHLHQYCDEKKTVVISYLRKSDLTADISEKEFDKGDFIIIENENLYETF